MNNPVDRATHFEVMNFFHFSAKNPHWVLFIYTYTLYIYKTSLFWKMICNHFNLICNQNCNIARWVCFQLTIYFHEGVAVKKWERENAYWSLLILNALQSLTGSLQGRITYREIPVLITGNEFTEYSFLLFWLHFFPCFNNIEIVALVPVMCTGNCKFILQGLKGCFNTL